MSVFEALETTIDVEHLFKGKPIIIHFKQLDSRCANGAQVLAGHMSKLRAEAADKSIVGIDISEESKETETELTEDLHKSLKLFVIPQCIGWTYEGVRETGVLSLDFNDKQTSTLSIDNFPMLAVLAFTALTQAYLKEVESIRAFFRTRNSTVV